jgi:hypothetical protein
MNARQKIQSVSQRIVFRNHKINGIPARNLGKPFAALPAAS